MKPNYSDIRSWIWGINPETPLAWLNALIVQHQSKFAVSNDPLHARLAQEYIEARDAYYGQDSN